MKKIIFTGLLTATIFFVFGQKIDDIINQKEVNRIITTLASDEMKGRKTFSPEIEIAANFIAAEFKNEGLQTFNNSQSYLQDFVMVKPKTLDVTVHMDGVVTNAKTLMIVSCFKSMHINENSGFEIKQIKASDNFFNSAQALGASINNLLVFVDTSFAANFSQLSFLKRNIFKTDVTIIFILGSTVSKKFQIEFNQEIAEQKLSNVVAVLPGKTKKDEFVIFSGHYDHIGIGKPIDGDSIYNGANDDAAGITAMLMLSKYFKAMKNNERTILFVAFTAEEVGGFGSHYFSKQLDPGKIVAMFNIEMIGTESKWGKNSAYITGYEKTDMGAMLEKNLDGSVFKFYPDPYPQQQLFYRSDNTTLARLGVPAHTISTSKMSARAGTDGDNEPNYHKVSDEVKTLDLANMTEIIKAIAISSQTIISGKDTPARVKVAELR